MSQTGLLRSKDKVAPQPYWNIPSDMSNVITLKDACKYFHYHRDTLVKFIKVGKIAGFKISGRWFVVKA